jgi:hypothetical protein
VLPSPDLGERRILFLRHHFTERLIANVGIVLVFAVFGFLIFRGLGRRQE